MHPAAIDHLVVTAPTLEVGARYIERMLGVLPEPGGAHARMGTHNLLLKTGGSSYLEVIAENPAAPAPRRPRWFDLDALEAGAAPRLATWVLRTDDIRALCDRAPVSLGTIVAMSRGDLEWLIAVPDDGSLILEGLCPYVIQWSSDGHLASRLPDRGVQLLRLEAVHPEPERIAVLWKALGVEDNLTLSHGNPPRLTARFATPGGERVF